MPLRLLAVFCWHLHRYFLVQSPLRRPACLDGAPQLSCCRPPLPLRGRHAAPCCSTPDTPLRQRLYRAGGCSRRHAFADPAPDLCDAFLQSRSPTFEAYQIGFQYFPIPGHVFFRRVVHRWTGPSDCDLARPPQAGPLPYSRSRRWSARPAPFGLLALAFPCACRINRTSEDRCHRFRNAGIACIQRTFPRQLPPIQITPNCCQAKHSWACCVFEFETTESGTRACKVRLAWVEVRRFWLDSARRGWRSSGSAPLMRCPGWPARKIGG